MLSLFLGLGLVHEGVEGVVEGVHEVGVVNRGLGACKINNFISNIKYQISNIKYQISHIKYHMWWMGDSECLQMLVECGL